nr:RDD family protein [Actinomycetospora cinnamomea]
MERVVIGEAVELDVRTARLPSRSLALALDVLLMAVLLVAVLLVMSAVGAEVDPALAAAVSLTTTVGVFVGYPLLWETLTRGRSPGKYAMGLRVVRVDGGPIVFRHALARALAGFIVDFGLLSLFTGLIGIVVSASSSRGQRVGDLLAGTVVVRERLPGGAFTGLPPVDPRLAAWATGWELSRLPDDLALAARQFLVRAPQIAGSVRYALADRLAADVAARVAPPPPAGVPAEAYLAAVLGERHRREVRRLGARSAWGGSPGAPPSVAPAPAAPFPAPFPAAPRPERPGAPTHSVPAPEPERAPSTGGFAPPG